MARRHSRHARSMARWPLSFVRSASAGSFLIASSRRSAKGAWWMAPSRKSAFGAVVRVGRGDFLGEEAGRVREEALDSRDVAVHVEGGTSA